MRSHRLQIPAGRRRMRSLPRLPLSSCRPPTKYRLCQISGRTHSPMGSATRYQIRRPEQPCRLPACRISARQNWTMYNVPWHSPSVRCAFSLRSSSPGQCEHSYLPAGYTWILPGSQTIRRTKNRQKMVRNNSPAMLQGSAISSWTGYERRCVNVPRWMFL